MPTSNVSAAEETDKLIAEALAYIDERCWGQEAADEGELPVPLWVDVTPEMAFALLSERNPNNRRIEPNRVNGIARDIRAGNYEGDNGETIKIDYEGNLTDGQNRLAGIVEAGRTVKCLLVFNVRPLSRRTVDRGRPRNLAADLAMENDPDFAKNSTKAKAIAFRVGTYDRGSFVTSGKYRLTEPEVRDWINANRVALRGAMPVMATATVNGVRFPNLVAAGWIIGNRLSPPAADEFFIDQIAKGLNLTEMSPARAYLSRTKSAQNPITPDHAFRYLAVAWNHFRSGNEISKLQRPKGGWEGKFIPFQ